MEQKDIDWVPVFTDSKQIYDAYPELFEKSIIHSSDVYIEKPFPDNTKMVKRDNRIFLLPSGAVSVTTKDLDMLWEFDKSDKDFFKELNIFTETLDRKRINKEEPDQFQIRYISGIEYGIKFFFFNDPLSCISLTDELDKKSVYLKGLPNK